MMKTAATLSVHRMADAVFRWIGLTKTNRGKMKGRMEMDRQSAEKKSE